MFINDEGPIWASWHLPRAILHREVTVFLRSMQLNQCTDAMNM